MTLEDWLRSKQEQPILSPLEEYAQQLKQRQLGSGMREHLFLLDAQDNSDTQCFCRLKKYGKDVFDPAMMPTTWKGCGNCV